MNTDPLRRLPPAFRLWTAALLCVAVLSKVWTYTYGFGSPGITIPGYCVDGYCTPDIGGVGAYSYPGSTTLVSQSPIAAPLAIAIGLLAVAAACPRTARTKRAARAATLLVGASTILAAAESFTAVWVPLLVAVVLVAPLVWRRARTGAR